MLDVSLLRDDRDALTAALARRRLSVDLAGLADLDKHRRTVRAEAEQMRAQQREAGKRIAT
ncbi:MAG: serine--tRNA ligase, partial [Acidimicrobiia bacterium]